MILASTLLSLLLLPQDSETTSIPQGLSTPNEEIDVEASADDHGIQRRLAQILEAAGGFEEVRLEVEHGLVRLEGRVDTAAESAWVVELADHTEGVVAVANRLTVREPPLWNLDPAIGELRSLWRRFLTSLPRLLAGLILLLLMGTLAGRVSRLIQRPLTRRLPSELLRSVASKFITVSIWLAGTYIFLRVSGLTQVAVTVVGGTGVLGIVLGFAFRDIAENFLASVLISLQRPFRYGDTIEVDGHQGVVQRVTPRGTILMDFEGNYIQIANALVYKSTIKNYTANPNVRQDFVVGIGYDARVAHAQEVAMDTVVGHSAVLQDPTPMVLVEKLASSTVNLRVYFWVDGRTHSKLKVRSALMRMVLSALEEEGVSMPDDAREVIFPQDVPVRMLARDSEERASRATATGVEQEAHADSTGGPPATPEWNADRHDESTDAEGGLASETEEINEQARRSRSPEEGEDVLAS